jgi:hypothetical protein
MNPTTPDQSGQRTYVLPSSRVRGEPTRLIARPSPVVLREAKLRWLELRLGQEDVQSNPELWKVFARKIQLLNGWEVMESSEEGAG